MKDYRKYFLEFIAIFLGISLGFIVDEIREQNQNEENYVYVLNTLLSDLKSDTAEIKYPIYWSTNAVNAIDSVLDGKMEFENLKTCSECRYSTMSYNSFNLNTTGFNLLNSGIELSQIKNRDLVANILEFYSSNIGPLKTLNESINSNAESNLEYYRDNCDWYRGEWNDSLTIEQMSVHLLSNPTTLSRTRHTQILIKDNFLPHLEYLQAELDRFIILVESELNSK